MTHNAEAKELVYWATDKSWFSFDPQKGYTLKEDAPQRAKDSYQKWLEHQKEID